MYFHAQKSFWAIYFLLTHTKTFYISLKCVSWNILWYLNGSYVFDSSLFCKWSWQLANKNVILRYSRVSVKITLISAFSTCLRTYFFLKKMSAREQRSGTYDSLDCPRMSNSKDFFTKFISKKCSKKRKSLCKSQLHTEKCCDKGYW